jgi:hypothetical protein
MALINKATKPVDKRKNMLRAELEGIWENGRRVYGAKKKGRHIRTYWGFFPLFVRVCAVKSRVAHAR